MVAFHASYVLSHSLRTTRQNLDTSTTHLFVIQQDHQFILSRREIDKLVAAAAVNVLTRCRKSADIVEHQFVNERLGPFILLSSTVCRQRRCKSRRRCLTDVLRSGTCAETHE